MALSPRKNFLNFYNNKPIDRFPDYMTDTNTALAITGMDDRAPFNQSGKDWYGCEWVYDPVNMACVPDTTKPSVLKEISEWREKITFPNLKEIDWRACAKVDGVDEFDSDKANYFSLLEGPFERLHTLMSFEDALCAMIMEPEEVEKLFDRIMEVKLECIDVLVKYYHAEVINFHDDWGTQLNLFFSPDLWRQLLKPQIKKAVDHCHSYGIPFELHCCGRIEKIIPELVEIGVDCIQCMGINDIASLKKITGTQLAYAVSPRYQEWVGYDNVNQLTNERLLQLIQEEIYKEARGGRYFSFLWPMENWWLNPAMEEIKRLGKEIYHFQNTVNEEEEND